MPAVHFDSLQFGYTSAVDVLADVSMSLGEGWHGLVGENGSGKTTLLGLILGELTPDRGRVVLDPAEAVVVGCPQVVDDMSPRIQDFANSWDSVDAGLRSRLHLDPGELDRWETLSPGERRRWQMASALALRPDILCVDEPTNHLDTFANELVVEEMSRFRGVGILVSHDRRLLDRLTTSTIRLVSGAIEVWGGSYSTASMEWRNAEALTVERRERLRKERSRIKTRLADSRRASETKTQRDQGRRRQAGVADRDARSMALKMRQERAASKGAKEAGVEAHRLVRVDEDLAASRVRRQRGGSISVTSKPPSRRILLSHRGPLRGGPMVLAEELNLDVERDTRLRVSGPNGSGKSTLLKALLDGASIDEERILWLPQELTRRDRRRLIDRYRAMNPDERGRAMSIAARLGLDPARVLQSDEPSPGEARKLWLAEGLGREVWVAVLDEPTNHLDLTSIESLESALTEYAGALVFVSHDETFLRDDAFEELDLG